MWLQNNNNGATIENPSIQVDFFYISVNTDQIGIGFEADTPEKWQKHAHCMRLSDKNLFKKLLTSNRKIWLLVSNFLIRSLSKSC